MLLTQSSIRGAGALGMLLVAASAAYPGALAPQKAKADSRMSTAQGQRLLASRSARFIENKGQWDVRATFVARGPRLDLWFTQEGIRYDQHSAKSLTRSASHVVDMFFKGGHPIKPQGRRDLGSRYDFYTGPKPAVNVRSYGELYSRDVVQGVDMRSYFDGNKPRYDLIVKPGADANAIKLGFKGATGLSVAKGELRIGTKLGGFVNGKPFAYQMVGGKQKPIAVRWALNGNDAATFALGGYDHTKPLVIDPVVYGTYFGGDSGGDEVRAVTSNTVAGGNTGSTLLTGATKATAFPTSTGFNNYNNPSGVDAFVSRLQGDVYNRDYALFFGGNGTDTGQAIKLDSFGNVWIAGTTTSPRFFSTGGTALTNSQIFVMRFTLQGNGFLLPTGLPQSGLLPSGQTFVPATFGSSTDLDFLTGFDVLKTSPASDTSPTLIVLSGNTASSVDGVGAYPTAGTSNPAPDSTGYVLRLNYINNGSTQQQGSFGFQSSSQYIVGNGGVTNEVRGVVFGADSSFYVTGTAYGSGNQNTDPVTGGDPTLFATTPGVFASTSTVYDTGRLLRGSDIFARHYDVNGAILYSGFIGGSGADECGGIALSNAGGLGVGTDLGIVYTGSAIALDSLGNAYITGVARSFNYPRTSGAYGETFGAGATVVVTKINATGSAFLYSTNLRTSAGETAAGVAAILPAGIQVDPEGNAFVTGNIRADRIVFPLPPGDPNQPTSSTVPSINIPANLTDVPDAANTSPTGAEFPTSEGFLMVLNSTGTTLQYATYLGGANDDFVYAPYVDDNGDVWAMGWTDGFRSYSRVSSSGAVTQYDRASSLPGALITSPALKTSIDTDNNRMNPQVVQYQTAYGALATQGAGTPAFVNMAYARDGFIVKVRVNRPSVGSISLNPLTIPGGLGASSTGTVTLTAPAPSGGAQVTVSLLDGTTNASLSATNPDQNEITLTFAAGATTQTFTVYSKPVLVNTSVRLRATYTGTYKEAALQVVPWLVSLTIPQNTVIGGDPTPVRPTVTLAAPAPAGGVPVAITYFSPSGAAVNVPFTVPAGQTSATFDLTTDGVDQPTTVSLDASLLGVTRTVNFTLLPAALQSVSLNPSTVAGGSDSTVTLTLNGKAGPSGYLVNLSLFKIDGVTPTTDATLSKTSVTIPSQSLSDSTTTINTKRVGADTVVRLSANHPATTFTPVVIKTADLTIQAITVSSLAFDPATVASGETTIATVTISTAAPQGGARVYLSLDNPTYVKALGLPTDPLNDNLPYVVIPAAERSVTFAITARYFERQQTVVVTASQAGTPKSATLTILPFPYTVVLDATSVTGSADGSNVVTGTITLSTPATEALTFAITSASGNVTIDSPTVTIAAGSTVGTFTLRPGVVGANTTITVQVRLVDPANSTSNHSVSLQVKPVGITSIKAQQRVIRSSNGFLDLFVYFSAPTPAAGPLTLTISPNSAFAGARTFTVPAGVSVYQIRLVPRRLSRTQDVIIKATYSGTSATTSVTVTR